VLSGCTLSDAALDTMIASARTNGGTRTRALNVAIVTDRKPGTPQQLGFGNTWDEETRCATARITVPAPENGTAAPVFAEPAARQRCSETTPFDAFAAGLDDAARSASCHSVLLYVHGYNTTFRSALLRAGQLAADTEWPCAMAAFSWGSEGQFDRYAADIERSGYAVPVLMEVLQALPRTGIAINIVAHSMGNRTTLGALAALGPSCTGHGAIVNELILAAPDVSSEAGNDDFGTLLRRALPCVRRVTVYASRNDMVLMLSESIHGGIPRAGLEPDSDLHYAIDSDHVEIVDASAAPGDPFGHGYFVESYEMLDDMMLVLRGAAIASRADARTLYCANEHNAPCTGPRDRYALAVSSSRQPDLFARLERHLLAHLLAIQYGVPGQLTP
jgi:esterase/lipase superfamily enzyme